MRNIGRKSDPDEWRGRRVTVMGLGSFGGGVGVVRYLASMGAEVTVTDLWSGEELSKSLGELQGCGGVRYVLGEHREEDFRGAEFVVVNPAVGRENRYLEIAREAGGKLTSEMRIFLERNPARVIGVTGSNGKSTTTAMTYALMQAAGERCRLGGNIGKSLLPELAEIRETDWVVLELSSFQLEDLAELQWGPEVAIVTNFTPNHLDRHGTLDEYRAAKQNLLRCQSADQVAVLNGDDADVVQWATHGKQLLFGERDRGAEGVFLRREGSREVVCRLNGEERVVLLGDWLQVPGRHNLLNALGAMAAALSQGVSLEAVERGLRGYRALPHRLEFVGERRGRKFFNDSLATTPESTECAVDAFAEPIVLLAGGYDKGSDLTSMARKIVGGGVSGVALMGVTGPKLGELIRQFDPNGKVRTEMCDDFQEAFEWAVKMSQPGDVVLLSPGCASYGWFKNFAERGETFRRLVEGMESQV